MLKNMGIKKVIFNNKATIIYLEDGTKGVLICSKEDTQDPMVGISVAYAVAKATHGNKSEFKRQVSYLNKKGKFEV